MAGGAAVKQKNKTKTTKDVKPIRGRDVEDWRKTFLENVRNSANTTFAAEVACVARSTVYEHLESDPDFLKAFKDAKESAYDAIEGALFKRAVKGIERRRPYYYLGQEVGEEKWTEYDTTAAIFMLKGGRPTVYRDNARVELSGQVNGHPQIVVYIPDDGRNPVIEQPAAEELPAPEKPE